ncbi:MAG: hypothetical protein JKX84_01895, partial [Flavobacteriales bacterium]|nr:hypothetical protein [Flavobacteriales bacterium]
MRNELDNIERIENYLTGKLSETERQAFETEMKTNAELTEQVKLQRDLMEGIARTQLVKSAKKAHTKYKLGKGGLNWGLGGFAVLVVAAAAWFFTTQLSTETADDLRYSKNEMGTEQFADADRFLPSQLFAVDGGKDTVIRTEGGITMTILSNTFLDENGDPVKGNIDVEVKEALDPLSIMKAGLTTLSGDRLLESGGMFYVNGRQGDRNLKINPEQGIYTQVPTDRKRPDMQLFDGKRQADGSIDWVDPKPLETFLIPVEITTLDFYPPDYLKELDKRGQNSTDKRFTVSLYCSFAAEFGHYEINAMGVVPDSMTERQAVEMGLITRDTIVWPARADISQREEGFVYGINPVNIKTIWSEKFNNTNLATKEFEERLAYIHTTCDREIFRFYINNLDK